METPQVFLRKVPKELSSWQRCAVYLDELPNSSYIYVSQVFALPDDITFKLPYFHYRIPDPNAPGWDPVRKGPFKKVQSKVVKLKKTPKKLKSPKVRARHLSKPTRRLYSSDEEIQVESGHSVSSESSAEEEEEYVDVQ